MICADGYQPFLRNLYLSWSSVKNVTCVLPKVRHFFSTLFNTDDKYLQNTTPVVPGDLTEVNSQLRRGTWS